MKSLIRFPVVLGLAALTALSACKDEPGTKASINSMQGMRTETQHRLTQEAEDAIAAGKTEEALALYGKLHWHHRHDKSIALIYAQLLRKAGRASEAVAVLTPFASFHSINNDHNKVVIYNSDAVVLNELAAANIATGDLDTANRLLDHVLADAGSAPLHADAWSLKGIVLDAEGHHREAEQAFNRALEGWKGDPTPVMNNLALCLANQGEFDQALDTLRRALVLSPNDKQEIARNIALITELRERVVVKPVKVKVVTPVVKKTVKKVHHKPTACGPCPVPAPEPKKQ